MTRIDKTNGIYPENQNNDSKKSQTFDVQSIREDSEYISSDGSQAQRSYAMARLFPKKSETSEKRIENFRKKISKDRLITEEEKEKILEKTNERNIDARIEMYSYLKRKSLFSEDFYYYMTDIVSETTDENIEIGKMMINDSKFPKDSIGFTLSNLNKYNIELAKEMLNNPDFPKLFIPEIIHNITNEKSAKLAKKLISDSDYPESFIRDTIYSSDTKNIDAKIEVYDYIKERKNEFGDNYKKILQIIIATDAENIEYIKELLDNPDFPKKDFFGIVLDLNKENMELIRKMISDKDFPNDIIPDFFTEGEANLGIKKTEELYLKAREKIAELNKELKSGEGLKGYSVNFEKIQNTGETDIIFKKSITDFKDKKDGLKEIKSIIRLKENGKTIKSRCEIFDLGDGKTLERTHTENGKYICESYYDGIHRNTKHLTKEIRIINGATRPIYVQKTVLSPLIEGIYDTTIYDLEDVDENVDVLAKIEKGELEGQEIGKTFKNPDGTITHVEEFQKNEYHTKREYTTNPEQTKTSLDYTVTDLDNTKFLDIHRTFELKGNKSETTVNGEKYTAEFNDDEMTAKIKIGNNEDFIINFKDKIYGKGEDKIWNLIKKTPGDMLCNFENIRRIKFNDENGGWSNERGGIIETSDELGVLAHETGHYKDSTQNRFFSVGQTANLYGINGSKINQISTNPNLIKIYNEEMKNFKKNVSESEQENISYFSQTGGSAGTGLSELVAEVNMLCTTQGGINNLEARAMYLTRYFPITTAAAARLLGY